MSVFLDPSEVELLTGKRQKAKQVEQLRKMGVPFFVNAAGRPVVSRAAVEGVKPKAVEKQWGPKAWVANATSI